MLNLITMWPKHVALPHIMDKLVRLYSRDKALEKLKDLAILYF